MTTMPRDRTKANPNARGTSNGNERGSNVVRKERKQWLLETYAADVSVIRVIPPDAAPILEIPQGDEHQAAILYWWRTQRPGPKATVEVLPTCRCYRCGCLLWMETVTVDRIKPGIFGGKYRTPRMDAREGVTNVRPACALHNSATGGALANAKKHRAAKTRAQR